MHLRSGNVKYSLSWSFTNKRCKTKVVDRKRLRRSTKVRKCNCAQLLKCANAFAHSIHTKIMNKLWSPVLWRPLWVHVVESACPPDLVWLVFAQLLKCANGCTVYYFFVSAIWGTRSPKDYSYSYSLVPEHTVYILMFLFENISQVYGRPWV
jgi:hypothetical protein